MGHAVGYNLTDEEIGKLFGVLPELQVKAHTDAEMLYEDELRDLRLEHEAYLEKWRDITTRRKATMAAKKGK